MPILFFFMKTVLLRRGWKKTHVFFKKNPAQWVLLVYIGFYAQEGRPLLNTKKLQITHT